MSHALAWYAQLSPREKLMFAALTVFLGEEEVANALVDNPSIDDLFDEVAHRIYT
jgi:type II secretory pathway component PulM